MQVEVGLLPLRIDLLNFKGDRHIRLQPVQVLRQVHVLKPVILIALNSVNQLLQGRDLHSRELHRQRLVVHRPQVLRVRKKHLQVQVLITTMMTTLLGVDQRNGSKRRR